MSMNFKDEIMLRGKECKTRVNLKFFEEGQNGKSQLQYKMQT